MRRPCVSASVISNIVKKVLLAVTIVIYIRYRNPIIVIPVIITLLSEMVILLVVAALIGWNLDLVAIAGILVAIGTGVDDQIVIADETLRKEVAYFSNWKEKQYEKLCGQIG